MRRRATFNLYVSLPDNPEFGADQLEVVTTKLLEFLSGGGLPVLNATWSCPEIGRKATPPGPVLAFPKVVST
jgi:hypothetical protein